MHLQYGEGSWLIDTGDYKTSTSDEWMQEIMSRTGAALLWVTGHRPPELFLQLISNNWHRIQRFYISDELSDLASAQRWTYLFERAAPQLEEFVSDYTLTRLCRGPTGEEWSPPSCLFSGISPVLRKVEVYRLRAQSRHRKPLPPEMPKSWFSRLRILSIAMNWDAHQLLKLLKNTPLLQELHVSQTLVPTWLMDRNDKVQRVVHLPHLAVLRFEGCHILNLEILLDLESITPPPGCGLQISKPHVTTWLNGGRVVLAGKEVMAPFQSAVMAHMQSYFHERPATKIMIVLHDMLPYLEIRDQLETPLSPPDDTRPRLSVDIPNISKHTSSALDLFTSTSMFLSVEELDLFMCVAESVSPDFKSLSSAFDSVTTLTASEETLKHLTKFEDSESARTPTFPRLRTLRIGNEDNHDWMALTQGCREILHVFLNHRIDFGIPIATLDITALRPCHLDCDLDNLEEFDGLLVLWTSSMMKTKEYVCGSGRPQELCFAEERASPREGSTHACGEPIHRNGWSGSIVTVA